MKSLRLSSILLNCFGGSTSNATPYIKNCNYNDGIGFSPEKNGINQTVIFPKNLENEL